MRLYFTRKDSNSVWDIQEKSKNNCVSRTDPRPGTSGGSVGVPGPGDAEHKYITLDVMFQSNMIVFLHKNC